MIIQLPVNSESTALVTPSVVYPALGSAIGECELCGTMHLAKRLEFGTVAVVACDDEVIPLQEHIESIGDEADLREVYHTERHLLDVACIRARDHLLVTAVEPGSGSWKDLKC